MICDLNIVNSGELLGLTYRVHKLNALRVFYQASYCVSNKNYESQGTEIHTYITRLKYAYLKTVLQNIRQMM